jgi:hypothetical protein
MWNLSITYELSMHVSTHGFWKAFTDNYLDSRSAVIHFVKFALGRFSHRHLI